MFESPVLIQTILMALSIQFDISMKNSMMNRNIYLNIINIDKSSHIWLTWISGCTFNSVYTWNTVCFCSFFGMADRLLFQVIPYKVDSRLSEVYQIGTTNVCSISKYAVYRVYLRLSHPYFSPFRRRVSLFAWLSKIPVNCWSSTAVF